MVGIGMVSDDGAADRCVVTRVVIFDGARVKPNANIASDTTLLKISAVVKSRSVCNEARVRRE